MSSCPSIVCMARRFAPPANRCDANEWRKTCGLTLFGDMPDNTAHFFNILKKPSRVMWPLFPFDGNTYFESMSPRMDSHLFDICRIFKSFHDFVYIFSQEQKTFEIQIFPDYLACPRRCNKNTCCVRQI